MRSSETMARVRAILEEELGEFKPFEGLPVTEIERMAARLTRALEPILASSSPAVAQRDAA